VGCDYAVRFVCPHCFRSKWVLKLNLELTLDQVLNTLWEFECPVDGPLGEKPFEAAPKKDLPQGGKVAHGRSCAAQAAEGSMAGRSSRC
jgi:hypothetical protein